MTQPGTPGNADAAGSPLADPAARMLSAASPVPGGEHEFARFYRNHIRRLAAYLMYQGAAADLAADIAQDAMITTYRRWAEIESPRAYTWITAYRAFIRHAVNDHEQPAGEIPEPTPLLPCPGEAEAWLQEQDIIRVLRALPPRQRQVLALTIDGWTSVEIAELLDLDPAAVRSNLKKARRNADEYHRATREEAMTGTPAYSPEPVGHWVATRHSELLDGLGQYLDRDAGLRDIMLHADHTGVIGSLGSHLDTQAGLAAILPPSADASPKLSHQTETAAAIAAVDPAVRMALRRSPVVLTAILSDLTVRALTIVDKAYAARERDLTRNLDRDLTLALERDITRVLYLGLTTLDLGLVLDLDSADLTRSLARDLDRNLARARDHARDLTRDLTRDRARDRDRNLDRSLDLARALARALELALASARVPVGDLARDAFNLDRNLDLARARNRTRTRLAGADLAGARLGRQTALMVGDALGITQTEDLAAALLEGVLDDFTRADLAHAHLAGRDLTGIRWSDWGTTWPPGTDTDALRAQSREVADGSGIYVIADPGRDDKARHHTRT